jgi:2-methylcitrate dehydratase PrpD
MDCALRLRDVHRVHPEDVVEIRCRTAAGPVPRLWEPLAAKHVPQNGYAAKFSLPYLLAVVLTRGRASLAEFEDDVVKDPAVLSLAARVGYDLDPTIDYPRQFIGHVRVRLRDGRVIEESQDHPRGGPDAPMSRGEIEAKFRGNASLVMADDQAARVIRRVEALAEESGVRGLMESLTY